MVSRVAAVARDSFCLELEKKMDLKTKIEDMARGYQMSAVLLNALRAGLFEILGEEEKTPAQVAAEGGLDVRAVDAVLRALVVGEVVLAGPGGSFRIAPEARPYLLADSPETMVSILGHLLHMMRNWSHLDHTLQTGQPPRREERDARQMRDFILGMENISRRSSRQAADKLDLSDARRLLDLGGGPGTAAITFARTWTQLQCVVFDLPDPVEIAREQIAAAGLQDRVTVQAGDFHEDDLGTGFDVVYISNILHMLPVEETRRLLIKARAALVEGGRLIIKDFFLEDSGLEPANGVIFNVNMLAMTSGGKTYLRREMLDLLEELGFGPPHLEPVATTSELIICRR
jgi:SAM-dependent methyltransferase